MDTTDTQMRKVERRVEELIPQNTRKAIDKLRASPGKRFHKIQNIANACYEYLCRLGQFYQENNRLYYLIGGRVQMIVSRASETDWFVPIMFKWFGLVPGDVDCGVVYQQIYQMAMVKAPETQINLISYYDAGANVLYVSDHKGGMFVLDGKQVTRRDNGHNDIVFFTPEHFDGIEPEKKRTPGLLGKIFLNKLWYEEATKEAQRILLREWFFGLFFHNILKERPLLIIKGDRGSGKTATIRSLGILLQGKDFMGLSITDNHTDFISNLYHNFLLLVDNVDERTPRWFPDIISGVTTGSGISVRRLYTSVDARPVRFMPKAYIGITTRTPEFNRDDITSRAIICTLMAQEKYDTPIHTIVEDNRSALWADILYQLNQRIKNLGEDKTPYCSSFRMLEFARLAIRANNADEKEFVWEVFDQIIESQSQFNVAGDAIFEVLSQFVSSGDCYEQRDWSANELFQYFRGHSDYHFPLRSVYQFGRAMNKISTNLDQFLGFSKRVLNGITRYQFGTGKGRKKAEKEREEAAQQQIDIMEG